MAGFATLDALQAAPQLARSFYVVKIDAETADEWGGMWRSGNPASTPGTAYDSDANALATFPNLPSNRKFLVTASAHLLTNTSAQVVRYLDRLVGVGGILITSTGDKTVNSTALTRYTTGADVQVYLEVATAGTTTAPVVSLSSYTNQDGTGGRSGGTVTFSTTSVDRGTVLGPLPLQSGDSGVRSVETLNVATAAGGSCTVNVLLMRTLVEIGTYTASNQSPAEKQMPLPWCQMQRIYDGASIVGLAKGTTDGESFQGSIAVALDV